MPICTFVIWAHIETEKVNQQPASIRFKPVQGASTDPLNYLG